MNYKLPYMFPNFSSLNWGILGGNLDNQTDLKVRLSQKAAIDHNHDGTYEPADENILKSADIGVSIAAQAHNHNGTYEPANANIQSHITNTNNPHAVTKAQVGLGNIANQYKPAMPYYPLFKPRIRNITSINANLIVQVGVFCDDNYIFTVPNSYKTIARILKSQANWEALTLDAANTQTLTGDAQMYAFTGGFSDGIYAYYIPYYGGGVFNGKMLRVLVSDFATASILDIGAADSALKGFQGGFWDGRYAYLMPYYNGSVYSGKIARVDLSDFSTVASLDLGSVNASLKGFRGGFTDGVYGYCVPWNNGAAHGLFARFSLSNFTTASVSFINLTSTNANLKGFSKGFTDGKYAYLSANGLVARVDLADFSTVTVLDLNAATGGVIPTNFTPSGGFTDGKFGYLGALWTVRFDLETFSKVEVIKHTDYAAWDSLNGLCYDGRNYYLLGAQGAGDCYLGKVQCYGIGGI